MSIIKCSATSCVYNTNQSCFKRQLNISGIKANKSVQTDCLNFIQGDKSLYKYEFASFDGFIDDTILNCSADNCKFNKNFVCQKDFINIGGKIANKIEDTCCTSFVLK